MTDPHTTNPLPAEAAARLRAALEQSASELDAASLSRLNRARQAALSAARPLRRCWLQPLRRRWLQPLRWGAALAACAVLGLALAPLLQTPTPAPPPMAAGGAEFALLTEDVEPALLEDLDFYAWLDSEGDTAEEAWEG